MYTVELALLNELTLALRQRRPQTRKDIAVFLTVRLHFRICVVFMDIELTSLTIWNNTNLWESHSMKLHLGTDSREVQSTIHRNISVHIRRIVLVPPPMQTSVERSRF